MNKKKLMAAAAALVVLAAAVALWRACSSPREGVLVLSGNIEAVEVPVGFRVGGRLAERLVDEGQGVEKGQLLARLESADLDALLAQREAEAAAARAILRELERGFRSEEVAQGRAAYAAAAAEAERLEKDLERQRALFEREVISRREFDAARAVSQAASARRSEAEERLKLLERGARSEQVEAAKARLAAAEKALDLARVQRGFAELYSPLSGLALAKHAEPGEVLAAGSPVLTVSDLGRVYLRAYLDESDLGKVKLGQSVSVTTDSYPGKTYPGTLAFLSDEAEFTPRTVQTPKERVKLVYRVKIDLANPDQELKPGMPAEAEVLREAGRNR
ncbi:MAG: efflux RND transporter periplasmic adaptor subunit [Acidobacteriota bacterium]